MITPPQPLPPALTRLATALELSSGFLLYFITGPRDHADSVFLRLRALAPEFEVVRHEIRGAEDLEFSELSTLGSKSRSRLIFMSGLERMNTAPRKELTERLNLRRDSWASYQARVVFWLPSWGLAEFRRIAPDLFDWRSGLIALNDADLPIRDELEYLVWACERHRSARTAQESIEWSGQSVAPYRLALVGLDPAERIRVLGNYVLGFAGAVLATGGFDLDPDDFSIPISRTLTDYSDRPPVPVLARAQDAAGKLDAAEPWLSLARAAGVPGPETSAALLASLAEQRRLLILLDGFDRLSLDASAAPGQWLEQVMATTSVLATMAGPAIGFFATWQQLPFEHFEPDANEDDDEFAYRYIALAHLIQVLFPNPEDLSVLARYILGEEADELDPDIPASRTAARLVLACARRGLLDASFFAELTRMRPAHTAEIETIARYLVDE